MGSIRFPDDLDETGKTERSQGGFLRHGESLVYR